MLVRLFLFCERALRIVIRAATVLHQGIWLGVLRPSHFNKLTEIYYDRITRYTDATYNTSGLHTWEQELIAQHFAPGCKILVAAAGGGRELVALSRQGFEVDGFDCNAGYASTGKQLADSLGLSFRLLKAPPNGLPERLAIYDGVIIGWGGYMHIIGRPRRTEFLKELLNHMRPGAPILISVFHHDRIPQSQIWAARIANVVRTISMSEPVQPGDWLSGSFDHHFTSAELREEVENAGLKCITCKPVGGGYGIAVAMLPAKSEATM